MSEPTPMQKMMILAKEFDRRQDELNKLRALNAELLAALQEFVDGVHTEAIKDNTGSVYFHARAAIDKARQ